jgi:predicted DNA-binding transcriptional regulator YafY
VLERYPTRSVQVLDDDATVVELTVAHERWLEELLLRLGRNAEVLEPPQWVGLGRAAAVVLLQRYDADGSDAS